MHIICWNLCGLLHNKILVTLQKGTSIDMRLGHKIIALVPSA